MSADLSILPPRAASDFLSPAQAAECYGYTTKTLSNWRCKGKGPRYVIVHGRPRYRVEDIERWLARKPKGGQRA